MAPIAVGFGLGVDRAILALEAEGKVPAPTTSDLFLIPLGVESKARVLQLAAELRASGLIVEVAYGDKSLKSAMKQADKSAARYSAVVGESELSAGSVEVKEMASGASTSVTLSALPSFFASK
jgi:histidyl-tRNA synthetase